MHLPLVLKGKKQNKSHYYRTDECKQMLKSAHYELFGGLYEFLVDNAFGVVKTVIGGNARYNIYDYSRGGYIQGSLDQVYDYVSGSYISLHVNGNTFNGYDYERGFYFNGQISNGGISFFDYEMALYYNYSFS